MVTHLAEIRSEFEGTFHHTRCFAHVVQIVARSFIGQFDVKAIKAEEIDTIVDADVRALVQLAEGADKEEQETREKSDVETTGESMMDTETEWVDEVATLTDEEREEFEAKVRPIKMTLVKVSLCSPLYPYEYLPMHHKIRKLSFKIVNSSTKLLPAWRAVVAEHQLPDHLLPRDVRTRWNSTYDMLNKALVFRKPIDKITDEDEGYGLNRYHLKKREWRLVEQLCDVLKVRPAPGCVPAHADSHGRPQTIVVPWLACLRSLPSPSALFC